MKREDVKKLLENGVLQAFAEGKTIQVFSETSQKWFDCGDVYNAALPSMYYRVKPEPRHDWVTWGYDKSKTRIHYGRTWEEMRSKYYPTNFRQLVDIETVSKGESDGQKAS